MKPAIPEEVIVDAVLLDTLGAAILLGHFANHDSPSIHLALLADIAREENIASHRLESVLAAFLGTGLISRAGDAFVLTVTREEALTHSAVLRGVAYARYRQRDSKQVEITLSPPAHPSKLMEMLPKHGFSWAHLRDTKDSLIELASEAEHRLVIVSPFLDTEGLEWIGQFFEASASKSVERLMIIRGRDQIETEMLRSNHSWLKARGVRILSYAISHDPALRALPIETFHAKILLADADKVYIGSANMTRWSRDFSMECGVIIKGPCVKPVATLVDAVISVSEPRTEI